MNFCIICNKRLWFGFHFCAKKRKQLPINWDKKEIEKMNFELPKKIIDKMKLNTEYKVTGFWNGQRWEWEIEELEK